MTRARVAGAAGKAATAALPQAAPFTLAVDIGGTHIKAEVLDATGAAVARGQPLPTPKKPAPAAVLDAIGVLAEKLPAFDRVSIGFPGVVKGGQIVTAPNLGTRQWSGFRLDAARSDRFGKPARILNDAAVQGLGVVEGLGLECVRTLGTGVGCALFFDRCLLLHLELGQYRARRGKTYDRYVGQAAYRQIGSKHWNRRVRKVIDAVSVLSACDRLYIGAGNARLIEIPVPSHVRIVSNRAGILGGIRLWEPGAALGGKTAAAPVEHNVHAAPVHP